MFDHDLICLSAPPRNRNVIDLADVDTRGAWLPSAPHYQRLRREFSALLEKALDRAGASHPDKQAVRQAAGLIRNCRPHDAPISHQGVRARAAELLYRQLQPLFARRPGRRWFFVTLLTDVGNSLEHAPVIELGRLKRDAYKMLDLIDFHGIGIIELQLARYPQGGRGRTIQAHPHIIGYLDESSLTAKGAERAISARSTLHNWLDARVADFKPIENSADLRHWCQYMFKAPLQESRLVRDFSQRSGFRTGTATIDCWGAFRLTEILAHLPLRHATFARGDLVKLKGEWLRRVHAWVGQRPARRERDHAAAFKRVWARSAIKHPRASPTIRTDAHLPLNPSWSKAMETKFQQVAKNHAQYDARASARKFQT